MNNHNAILNGFRALGKRLQVFGVKYWEG